MQFSFSSLILSRVVSFRRIVKSVVVNDDVTFNPALIVLSPVPSTLLAHCVCPLALFFFFVDKLQDSREPLSSHYRSLGFIIGDRRNLY